MPNVNELPNVTLMVKKNAKQNVTVEKKGLIKLVTQLAKVEPLSMETNANATSNITLSLLVEVEKPQLA